MVVYALQISKFAPLSPDVQLMEMQMQQEMGVCVGAFPEFTLQKGRKGENRAVNLLACSPFLYSPGAAGANSFYYYYFFNQPD